MHSPLTAVVLQLDGGGAVVVIVAPVVQKLLTKVALLCRESEERENQAKR